MGSQTIYNIVSELRIRAAGSYMDKAELLFMCGKAADEIERLERELAAERDLTRRQSDEIGRILSLETEAHENHVRAQRAESEAAAMREALEFYASAESWMPGPPEADEDGSKIDGAPLVSNAVYDSGKIAQAALSTDSGRKVMAVVDAAREVSKILAGSQHWAAIAKLRQALAALLKKKSYENQHP